MERMLHTCKITEKDIMLRKRRWLGLFRFGTFTVYPSQGSYSITQHLGTIGTFLLQRSFDAGLLLSWTEKV